MIADSEKLQREVAMAVNGISAEQWVQLDPAVKVSLRRQAKGLITAVSVIVGAIHERTPE